MCLQLVFFFPQLDHRFFVPQTSADGIFSIHTEPNTEQAGRRENQVNKQKMTRRRENATPRSFSVRYQSVVFGGVIP